MSVTATARTRTATLLSAALTALAAVSPSTAYAVVQLDLFRGSAYVPSPVQAPNYANNVAPGGPSDRYDGITRLITFANNGANRAAAISGTTLPATWLNMEFPEFSGADVLCEYPGGTDNSCKNSIQGAFVYAALLMPATGNYVLNCTGNDGAILGVSGAQGTDYRNLGYPNAASFCGATGGGLASTGTLNSPAANTLVNIRVAWNNWGNGAELRIRWLAPGSGAYETIPASAIFDPADPATYLSAANDDFSATPIQAGAAGVSPSVFGNDRVNVATPVSSSNIQTMRLIAPPAGFTLNPDGSLGVGSQAPGGSQTLTYEICRTDTQPTPLCAQATVTLNVIAAPAGGAGLAAVPTLGQWALAMLGLLLALPALRVLGSRR